jgi:hypothetical protein
MKSAAIILLMAVVSVATTNCGHVDPTSPSGAQPPASVAPLDATGQVVSIESPASGISNVVISGVGVREAHTDARGFFTLDARTSAYPLLLTHPDFIDRRTAALLPANGLHVSMIPGGVRRICAARDHDRTAPLDREPVADRADERGGLRRCGVRSAGDHSSSA